MLSRAFRNRFLEMQMDEIPEAELSQIEPRSSQIEPRSPKSLISPHISQAELTQILTERCAIPASFCAKMVQVMQDLP